MKKLVIDIKDGYAILATGGELEPNFVKIDFDEIDFGETAGQVAVSSGLVEVGGQAVSDLYQRADQIALTIPMRFSMVKPISIDVAAIDRYGDDYLRWESEQQLPSELGEFVTGFYKLRQSFDQKSQKYMFYASAKDFVDVLGKFVSMADKPKPIIESEAFGLFQVLRLASDNRGFCAAVSLEHDGASVVVASDGDFRAGRFIAGDDPSLGEEIKYYVIAHAAETDPPKLLVCGDLEYLDYLDSIDWAEIIKLPGSLEFESLHGRRDQGKFGVAAGLIVKQDEIE